MTDEFLHHRLREMAARAPTMTSFTPPTIPDISRAPADPRSETAAWASPRGPLPQHDARMEACPVSGHGRPFGHPAPGGFSAPRACLIRITAAQPTAGGPNATIVGMSDDRGNEADQLRRKVGLSLRALGTDLDRLDEAVAEKAGLHRTDLRCLEIVARDEPISAGRLAAMAGLSTSAVTSVIDRMERAGRMRRVPDSTDRRKVLVEVTALARREGRAAFAGLVDGTQRLLTRYSHADLVLLDGFLDAVRELVISQAVAQSRSDLASPAGDGPMPGSYGGR